MRYRGVLMMVSILVALFATTCSLQHETGATGADASLSDRYVTAWPPADWLFFAIGVAAAVAAVWIMTHPTKPSGGGR